MHHDRNEGLTMINEKAWQIYKWVHNDGDKRIRMRTKEQRWDWVNNNGNEKSMIQTNEKLWKRVNCDGNEPIRMEMIEQR